MRILPAGLTRGFATRGDHSGGAPRSGASRPRAPHPSGTRLQSTLGYRSPAEFKAATGKEDLRQAA